MKYLSILIWLILAVVVVIFTALNSHTIPINYHVGEVNVYLPVLLLIELILGAFFAIIALLPGYLRHKTALFKLKSKNKQLQKELDNLRIMPVRE